MARRKSRDRQNELFSIIAEGLERFEQRERGELEEMARHKDMSPEGHARSYKDHMNKLKAAGNHKEWHAWNKAGVEGWTKYREEKYGAKTKAKSKPEAAKPQQETPKTEAPKAKSSSSYKLPKFDDFEHMNISSHYENAARKAEAGHPAHLAQHAENMLNHLDDHHHSGTGIHPETHLTALGHIMRPLELHVHHRVNGTLKGSHALQADVKFKRVMQRMAGHAYVHNGRNYEPATKHWFGAKSLESDVKSLSSRLSNHVSGPKPISKKKKKGWWPFGKRTESYEKPAEMGTDELVKRYSDSTPGQSFNYVKKVAKKKVVEGIMPFIRGKGKRGKRVRNAMHRVGKRLYPDMGDGQINSTHRAIQRTKRVVRQI